MKMIHGYFTFNGNCREAMQFYQKCIGGTLHFQTVGDSAPAQKLPGQVKKFILQATLRLDSLTLLGTDLTDETGLRKGNGISLMLDCNSEKEISLCYKKLAAGSLRRQPLEKNNSGALLGTLTDKFGNNWILNYSPVSTGTAAISAD